MKKFFLLFVIFVAGRLSSAPRCFSAVARKSIEPIYSAIRNHPFNQELERGTLDAKIFSYYQNQDAIYLAVFNKALRLLAERWTKKTRTINFPRSLLTFDEKPQKRPPPPTEAGPATLRYNNFLLATATEGSEEELAAALLPCFWIYYELAREIEIKPNETHPFRDWILFYQSERYREAVFEMTRFVDQIAFALPSERVKQMREKYEMASLLEWYFWEAAYYRSQSAGVGDLPTSVCPKDSKFHF